MGHSTLKTNTPLHSIAGGSRKMLTYNVGATVSLFPLVCINKLYAILSDNHKKLLSTEYNVDDAWPALISIFYISKEDLLALLFSSALFSMHFQVL